MTKPDVPQPTSHTPTATHSGSDRDQQEFMQFLVKHERRLEGFILAMVPNWTIAEDIVQETKLRLWEQFDRFDRHQDFGAWARSIAYYQVLSYRTQHKRSREHFFSEQFLQNVAQDESMDHEEVSARQRFLTSCFDKLNAKSRKILLLVYSGKESIRQIAKRLGCGEASAYKTVQSARLWLHQCIEEEIRKEQLR